MPEAAVVSYDRANSQYVVLVRVRAPSPPNRSVSKVAASLMDPSCRAPIDLVTVLDVSGSMTAAKLQMLKHAMRLLISSLGPTDRLSIVAFSAGAKRLLPLIRMSRAGQRSARQIIERLIISGSSGEDGICIGHALRKATKVLEDRRQRNPVATIMLLSNGHQKEQPLQEDTSDPLTRVPPSVDSASATRFAHLEIPISPDGGGGSGDEIYPVENVFPKCVRGLVSLVLQDVHLQLTFPAGFVSSVYSYGGSIGGGEGCVGLPVLQGEGKAAISVRLGDFYAEEKRELLVELRMTHPHQQQPQDWMSYKCSYRDPITHELVLCQAATAAMPPLHSSLTPRTQELRNLFVTTRALVESRRLVDLNDLDTAARLLSTARSLLLQSNSTTSSRHHKFVASIDSRLAELQRRLRLQHHPLPRASRGEQLTPTSAWRAAEQLAKVAIMRKSMSRVGDLHGFENARF
ncbi:hypothetical protein HPP92_012692 [Vanilla planifolia]|uniref:VWFA domain-containing protein n=1 Tax=Vanilla planifolia TaxID=51239 RepID=A0A835QM19_VANPL|nr:hypothetical protein HPP92_012692 [Vanilla planifolia]